MKKPNSIDQMLADERQFPENMDPPRDLWPGIEQAISRHQQKSSKGLSVNYKIALSSAASIFVAVLAIQLFNPSQSGLPQTPSDQGQSNSGINALVKTFEHEKQQMLVLFKDQPAAINDWQPQLLELEAAATSLRQALNNDPNNAVLIRMLGNTYQQQLDLINRVHAPQWQKI